MARSKRLDAPVAPVPEVVRQLCPACFGIEGCACQRCGGLGYVYVSPYREGAGEAGDDFSDMKPRRVA